MVRQRQDHWSACGRTPARRSWLEQRSQSGPAAAGPQGGRANQGRYREHRPEHSACPSEALTTAPTVRITPRRRTMRAASRAVRANVDDRFACRSRRRSTPSAPISIWPIHCVSKRQRGWGGSQPLLCVSARPSPRLCDGLGQSHSLIREANLSLALCDVLVSTATCAGSGQRAVALRR
jgi:hypothetical protein